MKTHELFEAKSTGDKRIKGDMWPKEGVKYKGKQLAVALDKHGIHYIGTIDGEEIVRRPGYLGNKWKIIDALYDEVDSEDQPASAPKNLTVKEMVSRIKQFFGTSKANGWSYHSAHAGDMMGKNKNKAFTIEYEKRIRAKREDTGKQMPSSHDFLIQGTFSLDPESDGHDNVIIWLNQSGQIITVGIPPFKFKHGDFQSFENAIKKAMAKSDSDIIQALYKSGYNNYGRA